MKPPAPAEPEGPLAGVRVVAFEQSVAGPVASRILADAGADVIKVEPKRGDFARHWDSHVHGFSSHFSWLSRRKRSIALNLNDGGDRATFDRLLDSADILLYNLAVDSAERLRLTPERLGERWPALIVCQISGYGRTGRARDRRAYDMLVQAESGLLELTGDEEGPVRIGVSLSDIGTGIYATSLILAALFERTRTGRGRFLDLSMFQAMTEFTGPNLTAFANAGVRYRRNRQRHHTIVPYGVFACSDGFIALAIQQDVEWQNLCRGCLDRPDLAGRADLGTNEQRVASRSEVEREVEAELGRRTRAEWQERFDRAELAYGVINDIEGVWEHDASRDLDLQGSGVLPDGSPISVPRSPGERCFGRLAPGRVPGLDEHRLEILAELEDRAVQDR
ncbi:MAG: CaiB/BaiF CoA transferase family protein [Candidatus Dormibacter sp.]|uniref:CaiB/BaiF CoA transferase family protein n=1 Tax=Candidatus Dormibacter sp. TaxID=2973982 RepID=UPI003D9BE48D